MLAETQCPHLSGGRSGAPAHRAVERRPQVRHHQTLSAQCLEQGRLRKCSCFHHARCIWLSPFPMCPSQLPIPLILLEHPLSPTPTPQSVMHKWGQMDQNLQLTSFKLEMRPEEELERPKRFSMVVRLLLK